MGSLLKRLRPLAHAHWALPLFVVLAWIVLTTALPCRPRPEGSLESFLVCVVMTALWVNHLALAPVSGFAAFARLIGDTLLDLLRLVLVWLLVFIPLTAFLPAYQCYNDRMEVSTWLMATSDARSVIEERIRRTGSTSHAGAGLQVHLNQASATASVMDDGQIILLGKEPSAALVLVPSLVDGAVVWACQGLPEKGVPAMCRHPENALPTAH